MRVDPRITSLDGSTYLNVRTKEMSSTEVLSEVSTILRSFRTALQENEADLATAIETIGTIVESAYEVRILLWPSNESVGCADGQEMVKGEFTVASESNDLVSLHPRKVMDRFDGMYQRFKLRSTLNGNLLTCGIVFNTYPTCLRLTVSSKSLDRALGSRL